MEGLIEIILIALSLCIDTLAVTICGSVSLGKINFGKVARTACIFGIIQTLFIFLGSVLGFGIRFFIENIAPYISLLLLLYIGGNMIVSAIKELRGKASEEGEGVNLSGVGSLILAGIATSIDALAVGASMAFGGTALLQMGINSIVVFVITALSAVIGITSGKYIGERFGSYASILGGLVLIGIGVNIAFF